MMRSIKIIFILLFILSYFYLPLNSAFAHILETNGSIGAVMHIDPEDDPLVNEKSTFYFEFKDKNNLFTPQNCDCTVTILQNKKQIYTQSLSYDSSKPNLSNASFSFVFPQKDIYTIQISGKPKGSASFQNFTLSFSQRVSRVSNDSQESSNSFISSHFIHFLPVILGILFLLHQVNKNRKSGKDIVSKTLILLLISNLLCGIHFYHLISDHHSIMKQNKYACCTVTVAHLQHFVMMKPVVFFKAFIKNRSFTSVSLIRDKKILIRSPTHL